MKIALLLNILIAILEVPGFYHAFKSEKLKTFIYYTEISNFISLCASVLFIFGASSAPLWRYAACVMLTMTFLITLFILCPTFENGYHVLLLSGNGLFHHLLCPLISLFSYLFFETHVKTWQLPVGISMVYGFVMYQLNYLGKMDGPYPFFKVGKLGTKKSVSWVVILLGVIFAISMAIILIGNAVPSFD